jgi:hypothetical protein
MNEMKHKYTLDQRINYQIKISGILSENWIEVIDKMEMSSANDEDGQPVSTLIGVVDQAALQGLLRKLYYLGFPLISVNAIQPHEEDSN